MIGTLLSSAVLKLGVAGVALLAAANGIGDLTGSSTHSVLNTVLNLIAAPAALVAAWAVRILKQKIETGDTPNAIDTVALRADIAGLRQDLGALIEAVGARETDRRTITSTPVIERRSDA